MMKKITLLCILLAVSFGYAQSLPFTFASDLEGWSPDNTTVTFTADDGSGTSGLMQVVGIASQWDNAQVTFTSPVDLSDTANNTITFRMRSTTALVDEVHTHGVSFQNGTSAGSGSELNFTTTGTDWTDVVLNFGAVSPATYGKMVIFVDSPTFGVNNANNEIGTYEIDDIAIGTDPPPTCDDDIMNGDEDGVDCGGSSCTACIPTCDDDIMNGDEDGVDCGGTGGCPDCPTPPTAAATPPPARAMADVISVFSLAYTDETPTGVNTFAGGTVSNYTIDATDDARLLTTPSPGGGAQWEYAGFDLTDFTKIHLDLWVENAGDVGSVLTIQLQNFDGGGVFQHNIFTNVDINTPGINTWITVDVDLSSFTNGGLAKDNIKNVQLIAQGPAFGPTYLSNLYFHKNTVLSIDDVAKSSFKIFPNPTQDSWTVKTPSAANISSIKVFDVLGKNVLSLSPNTNEATIDGARLNKGLYFAQIKTASGISSLKLIKQ